VLIRGASCGMFGQQIPASTGEIFTPKWPVRPAAGALGAQRDWHTGDLTPRVTPDG
jgi:hypothetical protein